MYKRFLFVVVFGHSSFLLRLKKCSISLHLRRYSPFSAVTFLTRHPHFLRPSACLLYPRIHKGIFVQAMLSQWQDMSSYWFHLFFISYATIEHFLSILSDSSLLSFPLFNPCSHGLLVSFPYFSRYFSWIAVVCNVRIFEHVQNRRHLSERIS